MLSFTLYFVVFQERIYSVIERNIKDNGKIMQKRNKGNTLKFQLLPLKQYSSQTSSEIDSSQNDNDKGPL